MAATPAPFEAENRTPNADSVAPSEFWDDLNENLKDPEFREAFEAAAEEVALVDKLMNRIAEDDGTRYTLTEVAEMLGIDLRLIDGTSG